MTAQSAWIFNATEENFEAQVLDQSRTKPVLVDFWAGWCGPCRALAPILERVVNDHGGAIVLAKVDTDAEPNLAGAFQVESLPTVAAFRDGQMVDAFAGAQPEDFVREFVQSLMPTETDQFVEKAKALEDSDPVAAEAMYRKILAEQAEADAATLGLVRVLLTQRKRDEASAVLADKVVEERFAEELESLKGRLALHDLTSGMDSEESLRQRLSNAKTAQTLYELGCVLAANGKYEEALQNLLAAGQLDFKIVTPHVRDAMVQIFHVVGNQSELANTYRPRLSMLLY